MAGFEAAISRRLHLARLVDQRNSWRQRRQNETGGRSTRDTVSAEESALTSSSIRAGMLAEAGIKPGHKDYPESDTALKNGLSLGRHWHSLESQVPDGVGLLMTLPQSGPFAVSDSA